ncbi:hypothetical protein IAR55_004861 [Kwoniella newhampshirensis]|uniref:F-box domain-containing protein n=1 Tax=Kwoniella newhampshirensis TaxID=1651941 RepID=A0AAW0YW44_9TREE
MPKRQRSLSPIPKPQSTGQDGDTAAREGGKVIADLFPFQEIFLRILSFLPPTDLAMVQRVNRYWAKMSVDPQLWKRLYLSRYPHPHHSRLIYTASTPSTPGRPLRAIARLPSRAFPPPSPKRSPSISSLLDHDASITADRPGRRKEGIGHATPLVSRDAGTGTMSAGETIEVGYGVRNDGVDWKMMLRLGTNWSNGNALSQSTISLPPSPSPSLSATIQATPHSHSHHYSSPPPYSEQHIALFPSFIMTSSPSSPLVQVHSSSSIPTGSKALGLIPPPPGWSSPHRPDNVTAICADQSVVYPEDESGEGGTLKAPLPARLAVFYQSGGFVILTVRHNMAPGSTSATQGGITWTRESIYPPQSRPRSIRRRATTYTPLEDDPVVLASLYHPVLLTCTLSFHLSVYSVSSPPSSSGQPSKPEHLHTMHSDVSFHPAALSLFPNTDDSEASRHSEATQIPKSFQAALTYCTPLYPASWTVAVQEICIDLSFHLESEKVWRGDCWNVGRGDESLFPGDRELTWPRNVKPIVGVRGKASAVGSDGRWCVLAGEDNMIQVYSLPSSSSSSPSPTLRDKAEEKSERSERISTLPTPIVHSQTLLAHSAAVTSVALSAGRCVSGGRDGRVLVWELDEEANGYSEGRLGRTVGYVEVKSGGRRNGGGVWRGAAGPGPGSDGLLPALDENIDEDDVIDEQDERRSGRNLPHPQAISSAARTLFLPRPPLPLSDCSEGRREIKHLAFDEEKIVGLVSGAREGEDGVMKVWNFSG